MKVAVLLAVPLVACTTVGPSAATQTPGKCVAGTGDALVGQPIGKVPQAEIMRVTGAVTVRVVRPGEAVTMDYREDRVTVTLDARDRITRVSCG